MKKILFIPPFSLGNTMAERLIEERLAHLFEGQVTSLVCHRHDTFSELFDLIFDCDIITFMEYPNGCIDEVMKFAFEVATHFNKTVYRVTFSSIVKETHEPT